MPESGAESSNVRIVPFPEQDGGIMENVSRSDPGVDRMLSESGYSDKAIHLYQTQPGIGVLENADQVTNIKGPCGDSMKLFLSVRDGIIQDARIQVLGCPGAVASACAMVSLAKGRSLDDAGNLSVEDLYKEVEKLPDQKIHCARLALRTLHKAVAEYRERNRSA